MPRDDYGVLRRWTLERRLGDGATGTVYAAHDPERGEVVALKKLSTRDAAALYRFKREFRTLADVSHRNLVTLYELVVDDDDPFYTMELVEGRSFIEHVRPDVLDEQRLRPALAQLVAGVHALHEADKIHCDLKPNNVLVRQDGRVVILDFGIARSLVPPLSPESLHQGLAGTVIYMSPEQSRGDDLRPASDWYAVGVMLFEALTGRLPFEGSLVDVLAAKARKPPPPAEVWGTGGPADLVTLTAELLASDPAERPSGIELLVRLGVETSSGELGDAPTPGIQAFIGRGEEIAALRSAFAASRRGGSQAVYVHGESGMGKTAFIEAFLRELVNTSNILVLEGRCHERELVPYKALDGVIDSLSRYLSRLRAAQVASLLPRDVRALGRLFPVLLRLHPLAEAARAGQPRRDPVDGPTLRRQGVRALRELLARVAERQPLILFIDDLQWADADSSVLLDELLRPPEAPPLLLICSFRSEELQRQDFLRELLAEAGTAARREIRLGPLKEPAAAELARALLWKRKRDGSVDDDVIDGVVREAAGSPFLVEQLCGYLDATRQGSHARREGGSFHIGVAEMLQARVRHLPAGAGELLTTVAAAGRPLPAAVAHAAAGLDGDERPLVAALKNASLVRSSGSAAELELYHGRLREPLLQLLVAAAGSRAVAGVHARLAEALLQRGRADPEALYEHLLAAGERQAAAVQALRAADKASNALAFDRAALFYRRLLELGPPEGSSPEAIRRSLAIALADAGRPRDAAAAFLELAAEADAFEALKLRQRAAEELLAGGYLEDGLAVIRVVGEAVGLSLAPNEPLAALGYLWSRLRLRLRGLDFVRRPAGQVGEEELLRVDTFWAVSASLATIEPLRAADLQTRHLLEALRLGEPVRLVRALTLESSRQAIRGPAGRRAADKLMRMADTLTTTTGNPYTAALCDLHRGISAYLFGDWQAGSDACSRVEALVLEKGAGGTRELNAARRFGLSCRYYLGDLRELRRRVPGLLVAARERGDVQAATELATRLHAVYLFEDDPQRAEREIDAALEAWNQAGFQAPHFNAWQGRCQSALYAGDVERAAALLDGGWQRLRRSLLLRVQLTRVEALFLRARIALAGGQDQHARRLTGRLRREKTDYARGFADLLDAALAHRDGRRDAALESLRRAAATFDDAAMALFSAAARRRLGELLGGADGEDTIDDADTWMQNQRVAAPRQLTALLAPGFEDA